MLKKGDRGTHDLSESEPDPRSFRAVPYDVPVVRCVIIFLVIMQLAQVVLGDSITGYELASVRLDGVLRSLRRRMGWVPRANDDHVRDRHRRLVLQS